MPEACILADRGGYFVAEPLSVLIADTDDDRRRELGLALYEGGIEVVNAVNAEEALRYTAGLNPTLVVIHSDLDGFRRWISSRDWPEPASVCRRF